MKLAFELIAAEGISLVSMGMYFVVGVCVRVCLRPCAMQ